MDTAPMLTPATYLLAASALGGKDLALPVPLILGHGLLAAFALGMLWLGAGRPLPF